jgi:predicted nucleic acid-binding protein
MICIDASVAAKWLFPEEHSDKALALVVDAAEAGQRLVAPPLLPIEVTNIIRQRMRRAHLEPEQALGLLGAFEAFSVGIVHTDTLCREALAAACAHNLPAVYDAFYLALAEHLRCDLWTGDLRLRRALEGGLPFVKWIGDYPSG